MCFGLFDNGEKQARRDAERQQAELRSREAKRQGDVQTGRTSINDAFGQFDDNFFSGFQNSFQQSQLPRLDDQFRDARGSLIASLAGRGILESTVGADAVADIGQKDADARVDISNRALDATNQLRGTVESNKSDLFALNESSADPAAANTNAIARASAIQAPQAVSPLGDVFASVTNSVADFRNAQNNRAGTPFQSSFPVKRNTGSGSGRVIN